MRFDVFQFTSQIKPYSHAYRENRPNSLKEVHQRAHGRSGGGTHAYSAIPGCICTLLHLMLNVVCALWGLWIYLPSWSVEAAFKSNVTGNRWRLETHPLT
jgi:hypothetical protein